MFKRTKNTTSTDDPSNSGSDNGDSSSDASSGNLKTLPHGWDTSGKYFASVWDNKA